jgi:CdiI N-terminal domain
MAFSIGFLDEPPSYRYDDPATPQARGILILGEAKEYFGSSLYEWSKRDYKAQWRHAIKTLLDGKDRAALITEYLGPKAATHLEWWPMYVSGNAVSFRTSFSFTSSWQSRSRLSTVFLSCVNVE